MKKGYMSFEQVRQILFKELTGKGYVLEERSSLSSNSRYYLIRSGNQIVEFRVSDHKGTTSLITLRTDHKLSKESVTGFIQNRLKSLSYKSLMEALA